MNCANTKGEKTPTYLVNSSAENDLWLLWITDWTGADSFSGLSVCCGKKGRCNAVMYKYEYNVWDLCSSPYTLCSVVTLPAGAPCPALEAALQGRHRWEVCGKSTQRNIPRGRNWSENRMVFKPLKGRYQKGLSLGTGDEALVRTWWSIMVKLPGFTYAWLIQIHKLHKYTRWFTLNKSFLT